MGLLNAGVDANIENANGKTAGALAENKCKDEIVERLPNQAKEIVAELPFP